MAEDTKLQKPVEPGKEERAQLKKLMESHMSVLEHRLGRPPTMEEMQSFLSEAGAPENSPAPKAEKSETPGEAPNGDEPPAEGPRPTILDMQCYYGMQGGGAERKPDPNKILFYRTHDNRWYDTHAQSWANEPSHASHLPCRSINFNEKDIVAAIAHGVMEDQDYEALDKAGMVTDLPKQLWTKVKQLNGLKEQLEKSEAPEEDDSDESEEVLGADDGQANTGGTNAVQEFLKTAGVDASNGDEGGDQAGENLIEQIMSAAMAAATGNIEQQVTDVVHKLLMQYGLIEEIGGDEGSSAMDILKSAKGSADDLQSLDKSADMGSGDMAPQSTWVGNPLPRPAQPAGSSS